MGIVAILFVAGTALVAKPPALKPLRLICIPSLPLPVAVAQSHGFFARQGLDVHAEVVHSSTALRNSLASGKSDVAYAAVDNAVVMNGPGKPSVVVVLGGERSLNELIAQPGIHSISDLRGKILIGDAPTTAYALQLIEILRKGGLHKGDYTLKATGTTPLRLKQMRVNKSYAGTMLGPPCRAASALISTWVRRGRGPPAGVLDGAKGGVVPVAVRAPARRSGPASTSGSAARWTGVGSM